MEIIYIAGATKGNFLPVYSNIQRAPPFSIVAANHTRLRPKVLRPLALSDNMFYINLGDPTSAPKERNHVPERHPGASG